MIGQAERLHELNRLKRYGRNGKKRGAVFGVTSGKGGTGKSFMTISMAHSLARNNNRVLVVDLDANLSNINIMMNVNPEKNLYHYLRDSVTLEETIYRHSGTLHFIFGESGRTDHPFMNANTVERFFMQLWLLAKKYDFILLDTAAGAGEDVITILKNSDARLIVTTPEPTAVMDAYALIKLMKFAGVEEKKYIIVNMCSTLMEGKTAYDNLDKAIKHFLKENLKLLGLVERDQKISKSILDQSVFMKDFSESRIARQIIKITKDLQTVRDRMEF
ncbi:MAG: MinD/ParA family protein [Chlorobi bacterium]|nr:MinD/ParA family protein [Chlorobiota bacterium]